MRKIPTVYVRDPDDRAHVTGEVHPYCQWVLDGEGVPTRKYDGRCVRFDGHAWWARREVKPGKQEPTGFLAAEGLDPKGLVRAVADRGWEGIVWHHPDGRMAKLKARDLPGRR